ncbi:UDP-N-acetylmuramate dehydrogenase [Catalinimonas alkaloidigena]|uniref:UDP-N-acetylenolpyruvoylglucosamine reductase n=1 Tax=Catalinimonas alkaloidigena TaxID=1075417 RepID=A0A1G9EJ92_9BACT|nr:UDP-N-acetylmuramate dehydrogenase [Catalinimonas alkaloidigena]SDK76247.1 UDP-N-acetylmuramate dehydrogenase [Catalinimonas alkaloidigena]
MQLHKHYPLKALNTFGIEAYAAYFAVVRDVPTLQELLRDETLRNLPLLILGGGSNLLFTQEVFEGLVLKMEIGGITEVKQDEEHVWLKAGAGERWHEVVMRTIELGLSGIENLSLIPGTVGAAPMQNIGAYGVEIKEVFESLEAVRIADGSLHQFDAEACRFGYRESIFKNEAKGQYIITSVTMRLNRQPVYNVSYGAIKDTLSEMGVDALSVRAVSEAVIQIRQSKLPDPVQIGNAGSFFKNPEIDEADFLRLQQQYPQVPHYPTTPGRVKVPAGWLIDQCGWKGRRLGNVGVHDKQALVLVNLGGAKGSEVKALAEQIQQSVQERFGIALTPEVNFI